jgi:cytoskeletal protein RodZ
VNPTVAGGVVTGIKSRSLFAVLGVTVLAAVAVSGLVLRSAKLKVRHDVLSTVGVSASAASGATAAADPVATSAPVPTNAAAAKPTEPREAATATVAPIAKDPAPAPVTKPVVATGGGTGSKPHAGTATAVSEAPAIKEQLDRVDKLLRDGDFPKAIELANQTTFTQPTVRAYRQMTFAHCKMGNFAAQGTFHRVAAADRKKLVALCQENGVSLP